MSVFLWGVVVGYVISVIQTTIRDIWKAKREAKARIEAAKREAEKQVGAAKLRVKRTA